MIREIKKNDKFVCIKDYVCEESEVIVYKLGTVYEAQGLNEITDNFGATRCFRPNTLMGSTLLGQHFIPYTYVAISAHYRTLGSDKEAQPFARLLNGMEEHQPNGIYSEPVREGLTRSEFLELESVLFPELENRIKEGFVTREQLDKLDEKINWMDEQKIADVLQNTPTPDVSLPTYYDNTNGSLYKIAEQRGWGVRLFDLCKRLERNGKKDPLEQEIRKSIGVLELWLKELNRTN
jgi:hypothetical protein